MKIFSHPFIGGARSPERPLTTPTRCNAAVSVTVYTWRDWFRTGLGLGQRRWWCDYTCWRLMYTFHRSTGPVVLRVSDAVLLYMYLVFAVDWSSLSGDLFKT